MGSQLPLCNINIIICLIEHFTALLCHERHNSDMVLSVINLIVNLFVIVTLPNQTALNGPQWQSENMFLEICADELTINFSCGPSSYGQLKLSLRCGKNFESTCGKSI